MKVNELRKCRWLRLNNRWDWYVAVFFKQGMFANCMIKSTYDFETEAECLENMEAVLKKLRLYEDPKKADDRRSRSPQNKNKERV